MSHKGNDIFHSTSKKELALIWLFIAVMIGISVWLLLGIIDDWIKMFNEKSDFEKDLKERVASLETTVTELKRVVNENAKLTAKHLGLPLITPK